MTPRTTVLLCGVAAGMLLSAAPSAVRQTDLDELMARVLEVRDENWKKLQQYVLDERERFEILGPGGARLWGDEREFTWYIRDGFFVRSPVKANGVAVPEAERVRYEKSFLDRARERDAAEVKRRAGQGGPIRFGEETPPSVEGLLAQTRQPQFIDSAYFLRFRFEPGRYGLAGREVFEGREVLRIDYFPEQLFRHEQDDERRRRRERRTDRNEDVEAAMERAMNKVSLVTIWVDPALRQIVKYTFDNVDLDFLPASWLLRVEDLRASMTMGKPFDGVWLPRQVQMTFGAALAVGEVRADYRLDFHNYRQITTGGRVLPPAGP